MSDGKFIKKQGNKKKFSKKSKKFVLSKYDQMIVDATDDKLKELVTKELEEQITSLIARVNQLNSTKSDVEKKENIIEVEKEIEVVEEVVEKEIEGVDKVVEKEIEGVEKVSEKETDKDGLNKKEKNSIKKNIVLKLRKFKKCLSDENEIKKRVKMLKTKRRKLRSIVEKVQEKLINMMKKKLRCFRCRKRGHTVADCKEAEVTEADGADAVEEKESSEDVVDIEDKKEKKKKIKTPKIVITILCYNCGANNHSVHGCSLKVDYSNLPFAECFICKNKGHLSSACPTSNKGIYVRGGCCFICRKKDHLAKNCPQKQIEIEETTNNHDLLNKKRRNFSENKFSPHNATEGKFGNKDNKFKNPRNSFLKGKMPPNHKPFIKPTTNK